MSKYIKSQEAITSDLLLCGSPPTQTGIIDTRAIDYYPLSSIEDSDVISFQLPSHEKLMLKNIQIVSQIKVVSNTNTAPAANTNVSVVSNFAASLWKNLSLVIDGTDILQSFDQSYPISTFMDIILNSDPKRKSFLSQTQLFLLDNCSTKTESQNVVFYSDTATAITKSTNAVKRANRIAEGTTVVLVSDLNSSLLQQDRLLLTRLPMQITLTKNYNGFLLLSNDTLQHKVKYEKVFLRVKYEQPSDIVLNLTEERLRHESAIFHAEKRVVLFFPLTAGVSNHEVNNMFPANLPIMCVMGIQNREALGNKRSLNPWTFHQIEKLQLYLDGQEFFSQPPTMIGNDYTELFEMFYQNIGLKEKGSCLIDADNYGLYPLMACDFTNDKTNGKKHLNLIKSADVRLTLSLKEEHTETLVLVVFSIFDRIIEINKNREVTVS